MANTYYDSTLTAAKIDSALKAVDGVIVPANNGKVLVVENGKISVKPVTDYIDLNLQTKTATPSASQQTISPDSGYNGLSSVTIDGDDDLVASNIKKNVEIFGVVGTYEGGGSDDPFALKNYIQSSGTQYIDTGYICKDNSAFELVASVYTSGSGTYGTLFGARNYEGSGSAAHTLALFAIYSYKAHFDWGTNDIDIESMSNYYGKKTLFELTKYYAKMQSDDGYAKRFPYTGETVTEDYSVYLLGLNQGGSLFNRTCISAKMYRFRVFEGSTLVHEFIPWIDGNDVVCLKDTVTGNLKYNLGTGAFTYGTDT